MRRRAIVLSTFAVLLGVVGCGSSNSETPKAAPSEGVLERRDERNSQYSAFRSTLIDQDLGDYEQFVPAKFAGNAFETTVDVRTTRTGTCRVTVTWHPSKGSPQDGYFTADTISDIGDDAKQYTLGIEEHNPSSAIITQYATTRLNPAPSCATS